MWATLPQALVISIEGLPASVILLQGPVGWLDASNSTAYAKGMPARIDNRLLPSEAIHWRRGQNHLPTMDEIAKCAACELSNKASAFPTPTHGSSAYESQSAKLKVHLRSLLSCWLVVRSTHPFFWSSCVLCEPDSYVTTAWLLSPESLV